MNIVVLGGGISGLSTAYFIQKKFPNAFIHVIESGHWGGWIRSIPRENTLFESGPRTLRPHGSPGAFTLNLVEELGLAKRVLTVPKSSLAAKNRFVYSQSRLQKLPTSLLGMLIERPLIFKGIPKEILGEFLNRTSRKIYAQDESIDSFMKRRFGNNTSNLASAIIHGIYAGDIQQLSVKSTLGILSDLEEKYGSIGMGILNSMFFKNKEEYSTDSQFVKEIQAHSSIYSFKDGLRELPDKIVEILGKSPNVKLIQDKCIQLLFDVDDKPKVITETGVLNVDHVVSALPAHSLSSLFSTDFKEISNVLNAIPSVTVGVVNLAYPSFVKLPVSGFGYLVPKSENDSELILGTIFDSDAMPLQSRVPHTRLTVMMGGYRFNSLFGDPDTVSHDHLLNVAREAVKKHLGITFDPVDTLVNVHKKCIPQYVVGHKQKMSILHHLLCSNPKTRNRLSVVGASYTGVSVNDCVFEAYKSVDRFSQTLSGVTGLEKFI